MAATLPRYNYIISKYLDPVFAVTIGLSAAAVRIRREEREKGRDTSETLGALRRRLDYAFSREKGVTTARPGESG